MTELTAMIVAFAGTELSPEQIALFKDVKPFGYAIFSRPSIGNVQSPDQVRKLTDQLREVSGREDVPICVDQEGGRVQRFREPLWPELPAARVIGDLYAKDRDVGMRAARLHTRCIASVLRNAGLNTVFAPVADLVTDKTDDAIGDRGFSTDKQSVVDLVVAVSDEFLKGGIIPTLKHIPGYGKVAVDPHVSLPEVNEPRDILEDNDFWVFREVIRNLPAGSFYGMNSHVKYNTIDPDHVSTFSKIILRDITRGPSIGFDGLLMVDAIEMGALGGTMAERSQKFWDAGGDVILHCTGKLDEIADIAKIAPPMPQAILDQQKQAEAIRRDSQIYFENDAFDIAKELLDLLAQHNVKWAINKISPSN